MKTGNTLKSLRSKKASQASSNWKTRHDLKLLSKRKTQQHLKAPSKHKTQQLQKASSNRKTQQGLKVCKIKKYLKPQTSSKHRATLKYHNSANKHSTIKIDQIINNQNTPKFLNIERSNMDIHHIAAIGLIVILTLLSGFCDGQGFLHASNIWNEKRFIWPEATKSALGFSLGTGLYWICIRFLNEVKIISPELQTIVWFSMTILSVALFSGTFLHWQRMDQIVGVLVFLGVFWLLIRTAA